MNLILLNFLFTLYVQRNTLEQGPKLVNVHMYEKPIWDVLVLSKGPVPDAGQSHFVVKKSASEYMLPAFGSEILLSSDDCLYKKGNVVIFLCIMDASGRKVSVNKDKTLSNNEIEVLYAITRLHDMRH